MSNLTELHAHLGASTQPDVLFEIARDYGIKIGTKSYELFLDSMKTPNKMAHEAYLNKFHLLQEIQSSPQAIERSVYNAITHAYKYYKLDTIELRFNPMLRSKNNTIDLDSLILYACMGLKKATHTYPIKSGIIIETDRTFDENKTSILAEKAVKYKNDGVIGFDISGSSPKNFDFMSHKEGFEIAKKGGLGITVHAGEVLDHQDIEKAITILNPDRIGHGVKSYKQDKTIDLIKERNIHLEICPTSNLTTGVIKDRQELSEIVTYFYKKEVSFNFNTDGSEFLNTNIENEIGLVTESISEKNSSLPFDINLYSRSCAIDASFTK